MRRAAAILFISVVGCGSDATPVGNDGTDAAGTDDAETGASTGNESNDPETSAGTTAPGTGTGPGESSSGDTASDGPIVARGIALAGVYANQGVETALWIDGAYVAPESRNAHIVQARNTLVRAPWILDDGFVPRDIRAELTMILPGGDEQVAKKTFAVSGPSVEGDLDTNVWFVLPGELIVPGVEFQLALFEVEPGHENEPEPATLAYPAEPELVGVLDAEMVLKAVIVPIHHDLGPTCPLAPAFDEQTLQPFIDELYSQNPAQEVVIEVRDSIAYTGSLNSFNDVLGFLANLRDQDGADPAFYYYGVVRPCDGGPEGVGGQAISIPSFPEVGNAWTRVAVGRWNTGSLLSTAHTFVHEIGHTQGRRHVACSGEEGGPDPGYPYDGGDIGVWGFGVIDFSLHTPTNAKDYMTYCGNTWVSDYGWRNVVPFIQEITSWEMMGAAPAPAGELLVGLVDPSTGDETWFTTKGSASGRVVTSFESMTIEDADGVALPVQATIGPMGDGDAYAIAVELPSHVRLPNARITRADGAAIEQVRVRGEVLTLR